MFEAEHKELNQFLDELTRSLSCELVELLIRRQGKVVHIEVLVDHEEGGITLDECSAINKQLSKYIEEKNLIAEDYVVEVSSPGLDRPLKTSKDFRRVLGESARFHLSEIIEGKIEHMGVIQEVNDDVIKVETKKNMIQIPIHKIQKAVLIFD